MTTIPINNYIILYWQITWEEFKYHQSKRIPTEQHKIITAMGTTANIVAVHEHEYNIRNYYFFCLV